jgi:hypothetical protein
MKWIPIRIEFLPLDYKKYLVANENYISEGYHKSGHWFTSTGLDWEVFARGEKPTHYMQMPSLPKAERCNLDEEVKNGVLGWKFDVNAHKNQTLQSEFGCSSSLRFADENMVSAHDSEGNKIEIPRCELCDAFKSQLIGKESFMWICTMCGIP